MLDEWLCMLADPGIGDFALPSRLGLGGIVGESDNKNFIMLWIEAFTTELVSEEDTIDTWMVVENNLNTKLQVKNDQIAAGYDHVHHVTRRVVTFVSTAID